jgi:hypothetical protein
VLGHESTTSTEIYLHADEAQTASDRTYHLDRHPPGRYKPPDALLAFLRFLDGP